MARKYKCNKCGYIWESEVRKTSRHCLRCYSKEIRPFRPVRDKVFSTQKKFSKIQESTSKGLSGKFIVFKDTLIDLWADISTFVFVAAIFIIMLVFALIYIYYM
jgi:hypothetical protein